MYMSMYPEMNACIYPRKRLSVLVLIALGSYLVKSVSYMTDKGIPDCLGLSVGLIIIVLTRWLRSGVPRGLRLARWALLLLLLTHIV